MSKSPWSGVCVDPPSQEDKSQLTMESMMKAVKKLNEQNIPESKRVLVISPSTLVDLKQHPMARDYMPPGAPEIRFMGCKVRVEL